MATFLKSLLILPLLIVSSSALPFGGLLSNPFGIGVQEAPCQSPGPAPGPAPASQSPAPAPVECNKPDFESNSYGHWELKIANSGVSSMHLQLLPTGKAIMFDTTGLGPSNLKLGPKTTCRPVPGGKPGEQDCYSHAIEYDTHTSTIRPLKLLTDAWCSSGGLTPDGNLISTGGWKEGGKSVRLMNQCDDCDWQENASGLVSKRWYATQERLEDGSFILFGGRGAFSYELVQNSLKFPNKQVDLPFLRETTDPYENNLYPFAKLLPDGNIFLFANTRSVIINPETGKIVRELPVLPGGSRNYPASGMSALLPLKLVNGEVANDVEVIVCGGNQANGMQLAEKGKFLPALQDCGRINVMKPDAKWEIETMPSRRVMGDMLVLPSGELLIINGATDGTAGWNMAETPNFTPVIYNPKEEAGQRFKELNPSNIPRMYHSSCAVLQDGRILVAGSNTNSRYILNKKEAKFPTELRIENFAPPYLDAALDIHRPTIMENFLTQRVIKYGTRFTIDSKIPDIGVEAEDVTVTLLPPPFTTHGYSQSQRLLVLEVEIYMLGSLQVAAPSSGKIAPPGFYILYVVHRGVPSKGIWVKISK